jgi:predicted amidophosphoribosyltransferase
VGSPTSPPPEPTSLLREQFEIQRTWLRNMLPPSRTVCPVCRGAREPGYDRCYPCGQARSRSGGILADAVVPISYSVEGGQHYYQLKAYKSPVSPNQPALLRLAVLYRLFFSEHRGCLERAAGGRLSHVAMVPSTRSRAGTHPLQQIIGAVHHGLGAVQAAANSTYGNAREFHVDRFTVSAISGTPDPARILLLDDLWVTGARAQSMAHALKRAAAESVIIVTLGRQVRISHPTSQPILDGISRIPFALERCALDQLSTNFGPAPG